MKRSIDIKDPYLLVLTETDISENEGKKTQRYIFDLGVEFNNYENYKIENLKLLADKQLSNKKYPKWLAKEFSQ